MSTVVKTNFCAPRGSYLENNKFYPKNHEFVFLLDFEGKIVGPPAKTLRQCCLNRVLLFKRNNFIIFFSQNPSVVNFLGTLVNCFGTSGKKKHWLRFLAVLTPTAFYLYGKLLKENISFSHKF